MGLFSKSDKPKVKGFRAIDIVLFTFSAVFVIDSLGLSLTIGWASIIWWLVLALIFFLPYGLITAELTTSLPEGGIYGWVVKGMGKKFGARSNFFYWINVGLWMPSVYLILGTTLVYSISPAVIEEDWFVWVNMAIAIGATWLTWAINKVDIDKIKWLPNAGAIVKASLVLMMIISMIVFLATGNDVQTDVNGDGGIVPDWSAPFGVIGIIVYNMCGFELSSNLGDDVKEIKKTIPKSLLIGGITIILSYIVASIPAFINNNAGSADFQDGGYQYSIVSTLLNGFGTDLKWLVIICAALLALTLLTNMLSWTLGANRAIAEAAEDKELPASFARTNSHGCPTYASTMLSIVATVTILIGTIMEFVGAGDAYFILFSASLLVFFVPYIFIFISYIRMRKHLKNMNRVFYVKNDKLAALIGWMALVIIIIACITQVINIEFVEGTVNLYPVEDLGIGALGWAGFAGTVGGLIVCIIIGESMMYYNAKKLGTLDEYKSYRFHIKDDPDYAQTRTVIDSVDNQQTEVVA